MGFEKIPNMDELRQKIDQQNAEMEKKKREKIKEEYERLSKQEKSTEEKSEGEKKEGAEKKEEKPSTIETAKNKKKESTKATKTKGIESRKKESLEKEIVKRYYDELEKIKQMPENTGKLKKEKTEKYFQLIDSWTDIAYLDNYKGIQNIFSELDGLKPSTSFYDFKRAQMVNKVGLTMALNYKKWNLEDKEKLKIIKNFVNKESKGKNIFYSKDKTFKEIAKILASEDIPFKGNVSVIVKNIENPDIKSKTIAEITDIEKESIKQKKQSLEDLKKDIKDGKLPLDKITEEQLENLGINPKLASEILSKVAEILEDPDAQKKYLELKEVISKILKQKEEIPESVAKVKEYTAKQASNKKEKEGSKWGTIFEAAGDLILLFLILFILAELKGIDWLSGQAGPKKK